MGWVYHRTVPGRQRFKSLKNFLLDMAAGTAVTSGSKNPRSCMKKLYFILTILVAFAAVNVSAQEAASTRPMSQPAPADGQSKAPAGPPPGTPGGPAVRRTPPDRATAQQFLSNHPRLMQKYDVNKNNSLDEDEYGELVKQWSQPGIRLEPMAPGAQPRQRDAGTRPDLNQFLSRHPNLRQRMDRNGDGVVDQRDRPPAPPGNVPAN